MVEPNTRKFLMYYMKLRNLNLKVQGCVLMAVTP